MRVNFTNFMILDKHNEETKMNKKECERMYELDDGSISKLLYGVTENGGRVCINGQRYYIDEMDHDMISNELRLSVISESSFIDTHTIPPLGRMGKIKTRPKNKIKILQKKQNMNGLYEILLNNRKGENHDANET